MPSTCSLKLQIVQLLLFPVRSSLLCRSITFALHFLIGAVSRQFPHEGQEFMATLNKAPKHIWDNYGVIPRRIGNPQECNRGISHKQGRVLHKTVGVCAIGHRPKMWFHLPERGHNLPCSDLFLHSESNLKPTSHGRCSLSKV